eukprot:SAG31_NODE_9595_length_1253_cov_2.099653_2_plen_145_part_00
MHRPTTGKFSSYDGTLAKLARTTTGTKFSTAKFSVNIIIKAEGRRRGLFASNISTKLGVGIFIHIDSPAIAYREAVLTKGKTLASTLRPGRRLLERPRDLRMCVAVGALSPRPYPSHTAYSYGCDDGGRPRRPGTGTTVLSAVL